MVTLAHTFESGQSSGTTITTGNSATGGNAFDSVTIGSGAAVTYNSTAARGALCMQCTTGGTAAVASVNWTTAIGTALPTVNFRFSIRPGALTAITPVIRGRGGAAVQLFRISINTSGNLELRRNTTSTLVSTTVGALTTADTWVVRGQVVVGASSTGVLYIHYDPTSATPDETFTPSGVNWGTDNIGEFNAGATSATSNASLRIDDLVLTDGAIPQIPAQSVTLSESFTAADALARAAAYTRAVGDTITLTDVLDRIAGASRPLAEPITFSDAIDRQHVVTRALAEPVTFTDAIDRILQVQRGLAEPLSIEDAAARSLAFARTAAEDLTLTDMVTNGSALIANLSETVTFADTVTATVGHAAGSVVTRPNTGTTTRPSTGTVTRPYTGVVTRP